MGVRARAMDIHGPVNAHLPVYPFIRAHVFASNEPEMKQNRTVSFLPQAATIVVAFHFYNCNCAKFSNVSVVVVVWLTGFSFPHFFTQLNFSMHKHTSMLRCTGLSSGLNQFVQIEYQEKFSGAQFFKIILIWTQAIFFLSTRMLCIFVYRFNVLIIYLRKPKELVLIEPQYFTATMHIFGKFCVKSAFGWNIQFLINLEFRTDGVGWEDGLHLWGLPRYTYTSLLSAPLNSMWHELWSECNPISNVLGIALFVFFLFTTHHEVYEYVETSCKRKRASLEIRNESFDETTECIFKCEKIKTLKKKNVNCSRLFFMRTGHMQQTNEMTVCLNGIMAPKSHAGMHVRKAFLNWNG